VAGTDYWVNISQHGTQLGVGFLLTPRYALTAFHCLRDVTPDDERVELEFADGDVIHGRIHERSPGADLALIDILKPRGSTIMPPTADRATRGDKWSAPHRPSKADPCLSGHVLSDPVTYRCEAGNDIEALQLGCSEHLGDYSGYSGGPVERCSPGKHSALLGVLLEQYLDRQAVERASNVLFAATIAEVWRCFDSFNVTHLMGVLSAGGSASEASGRVLESFLADADSLLCWIRELGRCGVLDPMAVPVLNMRVVQKVIDSDWIGRTDD
jgi:hypothetical protein